jgi:HAD superfamily hydrolase (TIGR01549 family)
MSVKAVFFDLDGTLLDTAPDFEVVLNQLREEENLSPIPYSDIRKTVSHGARALIQLGFQLDQGDDGFESLRLRLLDLYQNHLAVKTKPFDGITELIEFLEDKNIAWGIATNKPAQFALPIIEALKLSPACTICPEHVDERKPHPESMQLAGKIIGCNTEDIIYVGDHIRDIECGNRAGSITIAASYGYIDSNDDITKWNSNYIVDHARDIKAIVTKHIH